MERLGISAKPFPWVILRGGYASHLNHNNIDPDLTDFRAAQAPSDLLDQVERFTGLQSRSALGIRVSEREGEHVFRRNSPSNKRKVVKYSLKDCLLRPLGEHVSKPHMAICIFRRYILPRHTS